MVIGAAAAIKLFPVYFVVYYTAKWRLRPLLAATVCFMALTAVTAVVLGFDAYRDYVQVVLPTQTRFRSLGYNHALSGIWHKLFDPAGENGWVVPLWSCPSLAQYGTLVSDLVVTVTVALMAYHAQSAAQRDLAFASVITGMVLVSPVSWDTSLLLLLVPIAVLACHARRQCRTQTALLVIGILIWLPQQVADQSGASRTFPRAGFLGFYARPSLAEILCPARGFCARSRGLPNCQNGIQRSQWVCHGHSARWPGIRGSLTLQW